MSEDAATAAPARLRHRLPWLLRVAALLLLAGSVAGYVRGNDLEADALERAGGDAGLYGVGVFFLVILLLPALAALAASAGRVGRRSGASWALVSGALTLAVAGWFGPQLYPLEPVSEDGLVLAPQLVERADDAYLLFLVLTVVAGITAGLAGLADLRSRRADGSDGEPR